MHISVNTVISVYFIASLRGPNFSQHHSVPTAERDSPRVTMVFKFVVYRAKVCLEDKSEQQKPKLWMRSYLLFSFWVEPIYSNTEKER